MNSIELDELKALLVGRTIVDVTDTIPFRDADDGFILLLSDGSRVEITAGSNRSEGVLLAEKLC